MVAVGFARGVPAAVPNSLGFTAVGYTDTISMVKIASLFWRVLKPHAESFASVYVLSE